MCGIAGSLAVEGEASAFDLNRINHRGPDGGGVWQSEDASVYLGHRRLAILDLSDGGSQPMVDPKTGNVIIFNGEIYNHLELREVLPKGIAWNSGCDTETLLVAFREWGLESFQRLRGMFAFAIWEAEKSRLWLVRDPLGIKPLYICEDDQRLSFASEVKLLMDAFAGSVIGKDALSHYVTFGVFSEMEILNQRIRMLPPGSWLCCEKGGTLTSGRFWIPTVLKRAKKIDVVSETRERIVRAVEKHLLSDVPVASFLSGGLDSSIVTVLAQRVLGRPLQAFSVGFKESELDESRVAREVAESCGADFHRIELSEDEVLEDVVAGVESMDVPTIDGLNTYIVSKAVKKEGVKVVLSGLGGDELFCGYPIFKEIQKLKALSRLPKGVRKVLARGNSVTKRISELPSKDARAFTFAQWRRRFFTDQELEERGIEEITWQNANDLAGPFVDDIAELSWAELSFYMRNVLLRDSDQMSMIHSLELRVPLLDLDVVEWVLSLRGKEKMKGSFNKPLLIAAFEQILPRKVYARKKQGFELPMDRWMRGPLRSFVEEGLSQVKGRVISLECMVALQKDLFDKNQIHWTRLWGLVVLGHWMESHHV